MLPSRFALVNVPFVSADTPSIQIGLLKAILEREGVPAKVFNFNLELAKVIGFEFYNSLCHLRGPLLGEWLFTRAAFPAFEAADAFSEEFAPFIDRFCTVTGAEIDDLHYLRKELLPRFAEHCAQQLSTFSVVGFSSTFQQNIALLAVVRRLKLLNPECVVLCGGANFETPMGIEMMRAFADIDVIVSGEADDLIVPLVQALLAGDKHPRFTGVLCRADMGRPFTDRRVFEGSMNDLPVPDYAEYFAQLAEIPKARESAVYPISVPFESSRGCWWGQKSHCTFCGLNAGGMRFRQKSPDRVGEEIGTLLQRYSCERLCAVDNIIPMQNVHALLDEFEKVKVPFDLFYEVKANLKPELVKHLAAAQIRTVQPGIESMSTATLRAMRKGITALQNICALRWLSIYGVFPSWNFLYGFPNETGAEFRLQASRFARLSHLPPPYGVSRIRLDRFSPNFENDELRGLFKDVRPAASYKHIYPEHVDLWKVAYFFDGMAQGDGSEGQEDAIDAVRDWQRLWGVNGVGNPFSVNEQKRPVLEYFRNDDGTALVIDTRRGARQEHELSALERLVLEAAFVQPVAVSHVQQQLLVAGESIEACDEAVASLQGAGLLECEDSVLLALPISSAPLADVILEVHRAKGEVGCRPAKLPSGVEGVQR